MLMILAQLVRSESFWEVVKVRSPHTGPEVLFYCTLDLRLRLRLLPRVLPPSQCHACGGAAGRRHPELRKRLAPLGGAAAGLLVLLVALLALLLRRGRNAVDARVEVVAAPVRLGGLRESYQSGSESGHSPSLTARE